MRNQLGHEPTAFKLGVIILLVFSKVERAHARKGQSLPRVSHSGEIALSGSPRLRSTLAAAPVFFAQAVVTEIEVSRIPGDQP